MIQTFVRSLEFCPWVCFWLKNWISFSDDVAVVEIIWPSESRKPSNSRLFNSSSASAYQPSRSVKVCFLWKRYSANASKSLCPFSACSFCLIGSDKYSNLSLPPDQLLPTQAYYKHPPPFPPLQNTQN